MHKKTLILFPLCVLLLAVVSSLAAGGAEDSMVSLSYLEGAFSDAVDSRVERELDASDAALLAGADTGTGVPAGTANGWAETRLKQADSLLGSTGVSALLLAGQGQVTYASGAVVDATAGTVAPSGTFLHRGGEYLGRIYHHFQNGSAGPPGWVIGLFQCHRL